MSAPENVAPGGRSSPPSAPLAPAAVDLDTGAATLASTNSAPLQPPTMVRQASGGGKAAAAAERSMAERHMWTPEETQALVDGCNKYGVGSWKAILADEGLAPRFSNRTAGDLKDRFRTYFPDAYHELYPNAKTHTSKAVRSRTADGSSIFEKGKVKERRPFSAAEDDALRRGYERYGSHWAIIAKEAVFEGRRKSTDLRDRFRNAFPTLYQQAGYKPRSKSSKKERRHSGSGTSGPHHEHAAQLNNASRQTLEDWAGGRDGQPPQVQAGFFASHLQQQLSGDQTGWPSGSSHLHGAQHLSSGGEQSLSETSDGEFSDQPPPDNRPLMSAVSLHQAAALKAERERQAASLSATDTAAISNYFARATAPSSTSPISSASVESLSGAESSSSASGFPPGVGVHSARSLSFGSTLASGQGLQQPPYTPMQPPLTTEWLAMQNAAATASGPYAHLPLEQRVAVGLGQAGPVFTQEQQPTSSPRNPAIPPSSLDDSNSSLGTSQLLARTSPSSPLRPEIALRPEVGLRRTQSSKRANPKISSFGELARVGAPSVGGWQPPPPHAGPPAGRPPFEQRNNTWTMGQTDLSRMDLDQLNQLLDSAQAASLAFDQGSGPLMDGPPQTSQPGPQQSSLVQPHHGEQQPTSGAGQAQAAAVSSLRVEDEVVRMDVGPDAGDTDWSDPKVGERELAQLLGGGDNVSALYAQAIFGSPGRNVNIDSFQDLLDPVGPPSASTTQTSWQPVSSSGSGASAATPASTRPPEHSHSPWAGDLLHRGPTTHFDAGAFGEGVPLESYATIQPPQRGGSSGEAGRPEYDGAPQSVKPTDPDAPARQVSFQTGLAVTGAAPDMRPEGLQHRGPGVDAFLQGGMIVPTRSNARGSSIPQQRFVPEFAGPSAAATAAAQSQTSSRGSATAAFSAGDPYLADLGSPSTFLNLADATGGSLNFAAEAQRRRRSTDTLREDPRGLDAARGRGDVAGDAFASVLTSSNDANFERVATITAANYRDSAIHDEGDESDAPANDSSRPDSAASYSNHSGNNEDGSGYASSEADSVASGVGNMTYAESLPDLNLASSFDTGGDGGVVDSDDPFIGAVPLQATSYDDLDIPSLLGRSPGPHLAPLSPRTLLMGLDLSNAPWAQTLQSNTGGSSLPSRTPRDGQAQEGDESGAAIHGGVGHSQRSASETELEAMRMGGGAGVGSHLDAAPPPPPSRTDVDERVHVSRDPGAAERSFGSSRRPSLGHRRGEGSSTSITAAGTLDRLENLYLGQGDVLDVAAERQPEGFAGPDAQASNSAPGHSVSMPHDRDQVS